ncbi:MAG: response regulator [Candidatus Scalindua sp.]|nr:MAG: response regulator [Candidatus Scalindua sp.]
MEKILIVDDEPGMRMLLEQTLEEVEQKGIELLTACNGEEAIECIKSAKPSLVFLDVMMPGMDGFEVCNRVKNEFGMTNIHILMLTARGEDCDKKRGKEVGVDSYMTKPFNPDDIVKKVVEILGLEKNMVI